MVTAEYKIRVSKLYNIKTPYPTVSPSVRSPRRIIPPDHSAVT